ncbi:dihydrolipoyl dehydrogenase family protein [Bacillus sp. Marseille-P3661]|uniref:dihydrolipoyl dehydrogenase family protein n=1 Tax=Bacillus sp. Marseille-P3661 TaxID=1936234 RepID=UPI000C82E799|nr:FAD-dependent oxidoreductase [Bacillus sp. Marseille-P3661]
MKKYQIIVIGGGAGGLTVAAGAASMGATVALIEKEKQLGGDCLHYGCVPSKAFIEASKMIYSAKKAADELGVSVYGQASLKVAMEKVKAAIADIQVHDSSERFQKLGVALYYGVGHFIDSHHIQVGNGDIIYGKRIVIATGSKPAIPPIEGIQEINYLTNESIFNLEKTPKRMAVIGGGHIGLELGQAFARFGTSVTVLEPSSSIMNNADEEIKPYLNRALDKEITLKLNTNVLKVENVGNDKLLTIKVDGKEETLPAEQVLIAAGRKANIESLHLDHASITTNNGYITVNDYLQTSQKHIFAIGDAIGSFPFTHAAGMEGKVAISNAIFGLKQKVNYESMPWVTYTDPEVFHLGMTENEARQQYGNKIIIYKVGLDMVDRFIAEREKDGILKVITDKRGYILGAHAVGKGAGDWMQELVYAKQHGHKIGSISKVIHPYPTRGSIVQRAADQYWREKLFESKLGLLLKKYVQWFR